MQTTTPPLPLAIFSASPAPAQRARAAPNAVPNPVPNTVPKPDSSQFSHALSREMEQRQPGAAPAAKPQGAPKEAASAPAKAGDEADADDAAAIGPVTDMLALMASFNVPASDALAAAAAQVAAQVATQVTAQVAAQAGELPAVTGKPLAALDADAAAPTAAPAADDKQAAFKDVKQAIEGATRFAMNLAGGGAAADASPRNASAAPSILEAGTRPRAAATAADDSTAAAAAAQQPDVDGAAVAGVSAKSEAAPARARETVPDVAVLKEVAAAPVSAPVQQASLAMTQAIGGTPLDKIAARVGTPGWDNQVGQKIIWMVAGKEQTASLTLNPPDMGPMQVVLNVTGDQATVTFTAAQPEVRQALEAAMPKLREMMGESGIALGNATVNAGTPDGRQAQQGEQPRSQAGSTRFGNTGPDAAPISLAPASEGRVGGGSGMVDTFA